MQQPEYMKAWKYIPQDIQEKYNLNNKVHKGYVYVKIKRGMYGLKQAAILAHDELVSHLDKYGYEPVPGTTCISDIENAEQNSACALMILVFQ